MSQDSTTGRNAEHLLKVINLCSRSTDTCRWVIVKLVIPQSKKYGIFAVKVYKKKLAPYLHKSSSCVGREIVKIHKKQNWFKRCGNTMLDNIVGLGMAMSAGKIVQNQVEVEGFGNLWGLLASRPVVSEGTYEILSFAAEFIIALIVFTLTEHFLDEYRQRKRSTGIPRISERKEEEEAYHPDIQRAEAILDDAAQ